MFKKFLTFSLLFAILSSQHIYPFHATRLPDHNEPFSSKDFILDVRVVLNDGRLIDLEMQMTDEYNWPDRSISYASRNFDQLKRGEYYINAKPVHSIGFLNFTLFEDNPEFNALYQLLNVKTKRLYSEKFSIHVIDLSRIDLATEEDRHYGIDRLAKLFKTKTWEDLRMITKNNETMQKAADSLYQLNSDAGIIPFFHVSISFA